MQDNVELKFHKTDTQSQATVVTIKLSVSATCCNFNLKEIEFYDKTDQELSMCCLLYCGCDFYQ